MNNTDPLLIILYFLVPGVIGIVSWLIKSKVAMMDSRTDNLEAALDETVKKDELNAVLIDKLEPLKDNLNDMKQKMDTLYEFLLKK